VSVDMVISILMMSGLGGRESVAGGGLV
jgi:hypothetical protein